VITPNPPLLPCSWRLYPY